MVEESIIYISDAASRGVYRKPLVDEASGSVIFTDGHFIARVSGLTEEELSFSTSTFNPEDETREVPASANEILGKIVEAADVSFVISTEKLSNLLKKIEKENPAESTVACPECRGRGEVEFEYYAATDRKYHYLTGECPVCSGIGVTENPDKIKFIKLNSSPIAFSMLKMVLNAANGLNVPDFLIRKLPKEQVDGSQLPATDELMFLFDISSPDNKKVEIGVMCVLPAFLNDRNTKTIELQSILKK